LLPLYILIQIETPLHFSLQKLLTCVSQKMYALYEYMNCKPRLNVHGMLMKKVLYKYGI